MKEPMTEEANRILTGDLPLKEVNKLLWFLRWQSIWPIIVIATGLVYPLGLFFLVQDVFHSVKHKIEEKKKRIEHKGDGKNDS